MHINKIKELRLLLNLSQTELANDTGLSQRDISLLENGKRAFLPNSFIHWLNKSGIDLNSFFREGITLRKDENIVLHSKNNVLPPGVKEDTPSDQNAYYKNKTLVNNCPVCEEKDHTIEALKQTIKALEKAIKTIEQQLNQVQSQKRKMGS
ncbi:MAG: helix-turn-helix transcriptional regulator [Bacteroidales bacterium]|nr:helix-turn-helix transcriptional regulator [Bacteroidales bacterium]